MDGVDVSVDTGEILSIVGESGSGKSVSMLAMMGLLPWTATITAGASVGPTVISMRDLGMTVTCQAATPHRASSSKATRRGVTPAPGLS